MSWAELKIEMTEYYNFCLISRNLADMSVDELMAEDFDSDEDEMEESEGKQTPQIGARSKTEER